MSGTLALLELAGYVGLLLWGTHMVTTGVKRGFGAELRGWLGRNLRKPWRAFRAGMGVTALLQSSTATGLMAASFTAAGLIGLRPALAVMLGANVGSTLRTFNDWTRNNRQPAFARRCMSAPDQLVLIPMQLGVAISPKVRFAPLRTFRPARAFCGRRIAPARSVR